MKKLAVIFSFLALFLVAFSGVSAQDMTFTNKTPCNIEVQLLRLDANNCSVSCIAQYNVAALSEAYITFPINCGTLTSPAGAYALRVTDGFSTAIVGTGCGLGTVSQYINCAGNTTTLILSSLNEAGVF